MRWRVKIKIASYAATSRIRCRVELIHFCRPFRRAAVLHSGRIVHARLPRGSGPCLLLASQLDGNRYVLSSRTSWGSEHGSRARRTFGVNSSLILDTISLNLFRAGGHQVGTPPGRGGEAPLVPDVAPPPPHGMDASVHMSSVRTVYGLCMAVYGCIWVYMGCTHCIWVCVHVYGLYTQCI